MFDKKYRAGILGTFFVASGLIYSPQTVSAEVFLGVQTSAAVPGVYLSSLINVDGGLGNLPTLTNNPITSPPPPNGYDFGALRSLDLIASHPIPNDPPSEPGRRIVQYTLENFTERGLALLSPNWSISPEQIKFANFEDGFTINFGSNSSEVIFGTNVPSPCFSPACSTTANFLETTVKTDTNRPSVVSLFTQQSASVDGFFISSVIDVVGGLSNLPTINTMMLPPVGGYDFGNLKSFDVYLPILPSFGQSHFTLADFVAQSVITRQPDWSISPSGIFFNNGNISFGIQIGPSSTAIRFNTDGVAIPLECGRPGNCFVEGQWLTTSASVAVPEPGSLSLLLGAVLAGALVFRRREQG